MKKMKRKRKSYNEFSISNQFSLGWKTFRFQLELGTELLSRIFSIKIKLQSHKNILLKSSHYIYHPICILGHILIYIYDDW